MVATTVVAQSLLEQATKAAVEVSSVGATRTQATMAAVAVVDLPPGRDHRNRQLVGPSRATMRARALTCLA